jgi:hypothetical protein
LKTGEKGEGSRGLPNILAITFTRNAAREMKERILAWLKEGFSGEGNKAPLSINPEYIPALPGPGLGSPAPGFSPGIQVG